MKAVFAAAEPVRNSILSQIVKSDGQTFVTKAALLHLVSHIAIHLVKIRALEREVANLYKTMADTAALIRETIPESQSETDPGSDSALPSDPEPSSPPSELEA